MSGQLVEGWAGVEGGQSAETKAQLCVWLACNTTSA